MPRPWKLGPMDWRRASGGISNSDPVWHWCGTGVALEVTSLPTVALGPTGEGSLSWGKGPVLLNFGGVA